MYRMNRIGPRIEPWGTPLGEVGRFMVICARKKWSAGDGKYGLEEGE